MTVREREGLEIILKLLAQETGQMRMPHTKTTLEQKKFLGEVDEFVLKTLRLRFLRYIQMYLSDKQKQLNLKGKKVY